MFRALARRFGQKIAPPVRVTRARLSVESLEAREVPAVFVWIGGDGTNGGQYEYEFDNPENWGSDDPIPRAPTTGDEVHFVGPLEPGEPGEPGGTGGGPSLSGGADCFGFRAAPGAYALINFSASYSGVVTLVDPIETLVFDMRGGNIANHAAGTDLTVTSSFYWSNGVLNTDSAHPATVHLRGTTATIQPLMNDPVYPTGTPNHPQIPGTIQTANTLSFENGVQGTCLPGTLSFTAGHGLEVNTDCGVEIIVAEATAKFSQNNSAGTSEKANWIRTGGWITVTGPGTWEGKGLPLYNYNGKVTIQGGATASFSGVFNNDAGNPLGTVLQYGPSALILLENGCTLEVEARSTVYLAGGKFATKPTATGAQHAKVLGNLHNAGAVIELDDPAYGTPNGGHVFSKLIVVGDFSLYQGVFRPSVGWSAAGPAGELKSDIIEVAEGRVFFVPGRIGPRPVVNAGTRNLTNIKWDIITGDMPVFPANPAPGFELPAQAIDWSMRISNDMGALELKHLTAQ